MSTGGEAHGKVGKKLRVREMGDGILRDDLRIDRHSCQYRKTPHQILGGCGCLCELCLTGNLESAKLAVSEPGSAGADREGEIK